MQRRYSLLSEFETNDPFLLELAQQYSFVVEPAEGIHVERLDDSGFVVETKTPRTRLLMKNLTYKKLDKADLLKHLKMVG
jgi:hypothetical protein